MDKIKIVFILGTLDIGGTEKQFLEIMRRLNRDRFVPQVLAFPCVGKLREEIEALEVPFTCLDFSGLAGKFRPESYLQLWRLFRDMVKYFRREKPHITQSYLLWANIYGSIAARIAGVPIIITGRRELPNNYFIKPHYRWLQALSNFCATAIISNAHVVKQYCLEQEKFVNDNKIRVISNGIDLHRYTPYRKNKRQPLNIPEDHHVVGIIANLRPCKGLRDFLKAAALVLQSYPQTTFLIVGRDDGLKAELQLLAKELHISDSIIFTGERGDIPEILSMFDILVSSSLTEGLSNAILEGMALGKPVIATNVGGTPELVVHEQTGLLVSPGNPGYLAEAMIRLLGGCELRNRLGSAGLKRVEMLFCLERMVNQTETFYEELFLNRKMS